MDVISFITLFACI